MLLPLIASADTVEINGIFYNLFSKGHIAEVTINPNYYSGVLVIPDKVAYQGSVYNVTSIGNSAFGYCTGLTSISIPNSVSIIGTFAFSHCTGLTSIIIPENMTSIGNYAFYYCTGLTSIIIPNSVTSIDQYAFQHCSGLTSITIPNSVTLIGLGAFADCTGLTSIIIPNSVTSIGVSAFRGCTSLTSLTIGSGVQSISGSAFSNCKELVDVYCWTKNVPQTDNSAFVDSFIEYVTLHVPAESVNSYKAADPWRNFKEIIPIDGGTWIAQNVSDDEDVYEIARYNLQGVPIHKTEKGVHIIVYSNYTTKTVIIE